MYIQAIMQAEITVSYGHYAFNQVLRQQVLFIECISDTSFWSNGCV